MLLVSTAGELLLPDRKPHAVLVVLAFAAAALSCLRGPRLEVDSIVVEHCAEELFDDSSALEAFL